METGWFAYGSPCTAVNFAALIDDIHSEESHGKSLRILISEDLWKDITCPLCCSLRLAQLAEWPLVSGPCRSC